MLQFIRSKAGSFVVRILFVLLIACFGLWGVGDFLRQLPKDSSIISVGSTKIGAPEIQAAVDRGIDTMKPYFGGTIDRSQAKQLGIVDRAVNDLINQALVNLEIDRLGLAVGDAQIQDQIVTNPMFHDKTGQYNRAILDAILAENKLTESQYIGMLHQEIPRQDLLEVVAANAIPPKTLAALLYRKRDEKRVADYVFLNGADLPPPNSPDDKTLRAFYAQNLFRFTAPEYRHLTILYLTTADVINQVTVSDDQLQDDYQQNLEEFSKEESRDISDMLLPDQATAKQAEAALAGGTAFASVAQSIAHEDSDTVNLGWVTRRMLPEQIASPAFTATAGTITAPIKTEFGWSILRINGIRPAHVESFEEAKPRLEIEAKANAAGDALYELSNKVEDAVAAGADLGAIAQQFNLKPATVDAIDASGNAPDGTPVSGLPVAADELTKLAFQTPQGQLSSLTQTKDGKFFLVRVDAITPASPRPFDKIGSQVAAAWITTQHDAALLKQAKDLAGSITPTNPLSVIASARHLALGTTQGFARDDNTAAAPLPTDLIAKVFALKPGQSAYAAGQDDGVAGQFVVQLRKIEEPNPDTNPQDVRALGVDVGKQMNAEILQAFGDSLRTKFPVTIDHATLDSLF